MIDDHVDVVIKNFSIYQNHLGDYIVTCENNDHKRCWIFSQYEFPRREQDNTANIEDAIVELFLGRINEGFKKINYKFMKKAYESILTNPRHKVFLEEKK